MKLDVIVPCFNEEGNLLLFNETLKKELVNIDYQVIYVNDGSTDNTYNVLKDIYNENH